MELAALLLVLGAFLLSGCKTKPPPARAEIQGQALTNVALTYPWKAAPVPTNTVQDNWLATFSDPQLDQLVLEAMSSNADLRIAAARVEQAAGYVKVARASLRPAVALVGKGGLKGASGADVSETLQGIGIAASWEPDLWGRLRYARNAARELHVSSQADYEFGRQSIAATVARGWFTAVETLLQRKLGEEMVRYSGELVNLAQKREQVGAGGQQDVVLAQASLSTYQDSLTQIELAHAQGWTEGRYEAEYRNPQPIH